MTDPNDITGLVAQAAGSAEGVSVLVVTPNEGIARQVAPELARHLHPGRRFLRNILHIEWLPQQGGYEVVVQVAPGQDSSGATPADYTCTFPTPEGMP